MPVAPQKKPAFDTREQEVFLSVWRTYYRLHALEEELFSAYDLTPQQYNALRVLRSRHPECVPTLTLAARLVSRSPDITRMLDKLQERNFISRERPDKNRRQVLVGITEAGLELLKRLDGAVRECHAKQVGHLTAVEQEQLIQLLRRARAPHEESESQWK